MADYILATTAADTDATIQQVSVNTADIASNAAIMLVDSDALTPVTGVNKLLTQADTGAGSGDMLKSVYDTNDDGIVDNAALVNSLSVETAVPVAAVFTDTTYSVGDGGLTEINFTSADNVKLDAIETSANNYIHPSADGDKHVPANGTTNTGKVLTAGALAGVATWETSPAGVTDHTLLSNIGTNSHLNIDTHIADGAIHVTDHTNLTSIGSNTHATIDSHIASTTVHVTADQAAGLDANVTNPLTALNAVATIADIPASGGDMLKSVYDTNDDGIVDNAALVNNLSVETAVPVAAVFTDTTYSIGNGGLTEVNFTSTDNTKLDGIATSANNYIHPVGDGSNHMPFMGTTSDGKVLTATGFPGVAAWETPAAAAGDMLKSVYDTNDDGIVNNAALVAGFSVGVSVPASAEFIDKAVRFDVTYYGATGDGATDDGGSIRSAITAAQLVATATSRITIIIPPGEYNFSGVLDFGANLDVYAVGARLVSTDTAGAGSRIILGATGVSNDYGSYQGLSIISEWSRNGASGHKFFDEDYVGIEFINITNSTVHVAFVENFTTGIRISADDACAYNNMTFNSIRACKISINIHSLGSGGWVNENKYFGGNFQVTSNLLNFGSCYGVKFTTAAAGYYGHNQNVFFGPCFQLGTPTAYPISGTVAYHEVYYNSTTFLEYRVASNGETQTSGTTAPTHTSGFALDSNSVNWEYIGPCRRAPIYYNDSGNKNRVYGARWETGFGPFMIADGATTNASGRRGEGSMFEVALKQSPTQIGPDIDEGNIDGSYIASADNKIVGYDSRHFEVESFKNIHKTAITSSSGTTVPGFDHGRYNFFTPEEYGQHLEILYDGIFLEQFDDTISIIVDTNTVKRFYLSTDGPSRSVGPRFRIKCLDEDHVEFTDLLTADGRIWNNKCNTLTASEYIEGAHYTTSRAVGVHEDTKFVRMHFQGTTAAIISDVTLESGTTYVGVDSHNKMSISNMIPTSKHLRYSYGTPLVGFFESPGETIINLNTTAAQPISWFVNTVGMLANAWVTATAYVIGSLVEDTASVYRCTVDHTSGATFAGDSANWTLINTEASITASSTTY